MKWRALFLLILLTLLLIFFRMSIFCLHVCTWPCDVWYLWRPEKGVEFSGTWVTLSNATDALEEYQAFNYFAISPHLGWPYSLGKKIGDSLHLTLLTPSPFLCCLSYPWCLLFCLLLFFTWLRCSNTFNFRKTIFSSPFLTITWYFTLWFSTLVTLRRMAVVLSVHSWHEQSHV